MTPLLLFLILCFAAATAYNMSLHTENYPAPYTKNNRVLGLVLAYNLGHFDPILLILNEYNTMCEAGWEVHLVLFTVHPWSNQLKRVLRQKSFCYRINNFIRISYSLHDPSISIGLGAEHRKYMASRTEEYDVFVYHEDDIVFKHTHLVAYLSETLKLHKLLPEDGLLNNLIGFQRYRRISFMNGWGENDIFEQELLEETPNFRPICVKTEPYLSVEGNIHQAMWVLTKSQVDMLQEKCLFLNQSSPSREYMSSFSLFDHKKYHCGLSKLLPGKRFMTFSVLHYYQQRHVSWTPLFIADENIRGGFHYASNFKTKNDIPDCWTSIVAEGLKELNLTTPNDTAHRTMIRRTTSTLTPIQNTHSAHSSHYLNSEISISQLSSLLLEKVSKGLWSALNNIVRLN